MSKAVPTLRFRHNSAITVAGIIMFIAGLSLARWAPSLLVLLVVPLLVAVWGWRAGTDVNDEAVTVRAAIASRRLPWSEITGFTTDGKGRVMVQLRTGTQMRLTAVGPGDLPAIVDRARTT